MYRGLVLRAVGLRLLVSFLELIYPTLVQATVDFSKRNELQHHVPVQTEYTHDSLFAFALLLFCGLTVCIEC